MVIHYTDEDVKELFDSDEFNNNLLAYKKDNSKKISELSSFFNSLDINKKYYKMNISSKNKKFKNNLSDETLIIKYINNELNKVTEENISVTIQNINNKILENKTLLPLIIDTIINKCIYQLQYIDYYINILMELLNIESNIDIDSIIRKKSNEIFSIDIELEDTYDNLCKVNKNIDEFIGISILIIKLELLSVINDYTDNIIVNMMEKAKVDDNDISYKYILSLYNIFKLLDKDYVNRNLDKLKELSNNEKICKKNKFKIMDILDLIKT
jgi:hypothetical protein